MSLVPGAALGPYRILEKIGEGGMGEVYRARDTQLKRDVALKVLPAALTADAARLARFTREAELLAALNHPHIVTIHAILESPHGQAIVMELIQGPTLRALVADRPGSDEAVRLGAQVATALAAAHAAGLVHRDLKPENVMVRHDGYVKVLDFGLARLAPDGAGPSAAETGLATAPGAVMGTWRYMAPEQARDAAVTGAADVFALGLVLYELATGRHPFEADSNLEVLHRITSDPPAPASRLNPTVPAALDTLIDSMLAKEPRRRPTAAAVAETLTALTARAVMSTPPPAVHRARRTTVGRLAERQALLAAFEAVAAERGLVVGIAGEAGIGKTTLVEEFVTDLAAGGHACTLARGRCSERLAGTEAYLPWLEALESLVRGEGGPARAGLLKTAAPTWYAQVMPLAPDDSSAARLLADVKTASQERLKRELAAFLEELGRQCPVVLFFDDLHWADASTVDLLAYVAGRFDRVRALVVATYRPAELALAAHPFGASKLDLAARGVARELALGFLARDEVEQYVGLTFPGHRFPPAFTELVHAKTEGNPLFVADLLRELRDRGILAEREGAWALTRELPGVECELPTSVRSLIERKIAQVGDADRRLLQAASVQGCDFDSAVAARALGMDAADVEDRLEALERVHALVSRVEESLLPDGTPNLRSRFVHVLYQNALYDSLTPSRRAALSRAVAEALLGHCGARKADLAASLALLFETARDVDRSVRFFTVAAEHAADKSAHQESSALARRGLAAAGLLPEGSARAELELPLLLALGTAETVLHGWATHEVEQLFGRARSISKQLGRSEALVGALWGLGSVYYVRADYRTGITFVEQMFDLATQFEDPIVELYAEWGLGAACHNMGQLTASRSHLERAVELYDPSRAQGLTVRFGLDAGAGAHAYLNLVLTLLGYPDRAVNAGHTAVHLARGLSHPFTLAYTLTYVAQGDLIRRSASRAEGHAVEADGLCGEHGLALRPHARFLRAVAQTGAVPDERLMGEMSRALDALADQRAASGQPNFLAWLAQLAGKCGQVNEALDSIDRALAAAEQHAERYFEPEVHRIKGELLLKRDPPNGAEAERSFLRAIDVARGQEARWWELRASVSLGRLWQRQGRRDEARALVAAIYGWFTEGFETVDLKEARALLEGLEDRPHLARSAPASIVVLPFANLSSDLEQEYFSDGLTEEIIADLSQVRALRVISRTSAMHYKGTTKPLPTIAQELNVRHVLEGSVRKAGNNLRITAQLIDASTDAHLWAEKYSGTLDDVFDMQEKVSRAIVGALRATLAPDEDRRLTERPLPNSLAYDAYLRARQDIARWTEPALDRAQTQLEQALVLVGDHPVLLAGMGSVYFTRYFGAFQMDDETLQKAEDHARRAVGMDPAVAEGHFVLGMIGWAQGRMRTAFDELRLALSLNPSDTDAMSYLAEIACYVGKPVTSGPLVERLLEIDPLASNTYVASVFHHVYNGRFDAALEPARTAFRLDPESHRTRFAYFLACMSAGRSAESAPMVERWRREAPDHSWPELVNAWLAAERGEEIPVSRRTLEVAWMDMSAAGHGVPTVYAMLGRTDEALRWLTRGVDLGFINYPFFAHLEPRFESLRGDERFQSLMVRVKREWEAFEA